MNGDEEQKKQVDPKMSLRRKIAVVIFVIVGLVVIASGATLLYYNLSNGPDGWAYSNVYHVRSSTYAFTAYMNEYRISTWAFLGIKNVAEMKFIATSIDPTKQLFIGYATTAQSKAYSDSFERELPTYWHYTGTPYYSEINITTTMITGTGAPAQLPQNQTFWVALAEGSGTITMTYLPQHEQHVWFIMNQDGSKNVSANIQIAFRSPILMVLPPILLVLGFILIGAGMYLFLRKKNPVKEKST